MGVGLQSRLEDVADAPSHTYIHYTKAHFYSVVWWHRKISVSCNARQRFARAYVRRILINDEINFSFFTVGIFWLPE